MKNNKSELKNSQQFVSGTNPAHALAVLDAQMEASGMDAGHPWRRQLAAAIAPLASTVPAFSDEIDLITLSTETLDGLLRLALQACADAGRDDKVGPAIRAARRYVGDINEYAAHMTRTAA